MLGRGALVSRAQRSAKWCAADPDHFSLWRSRISDAPLHCRPRCTASGTRDSVGRVRSLIHFSNSPSRSRGACLRPGFATLLHRRNAKHRKQWVATLTRYAYPVFGNLSVAAIDSGLVFNALKPLVADKPVTASRLRGRIETVLDFARAAGRRDGDNPADKAIIGHLLPLRSEKAGVKHQPALPFAKLPAFITELRKMQGLPARLLEVIVLSGMRLDAVRPARCAEFNLGAPVPEWVIPHSRMKNLGRDQRVPLVGRALAIARELTAGRDPEAPVFGNHRPINPNAIRKSVLPNYLKAIGHEAPAVTHGFRSCLKDWCHETTSFPHEVVEQALGHRIKSTVERSYRRGDLFERRRSLMAAWDRFCNGDAVAEVIELPAA